MLKPKQNLHDFNWKATLTVNMSVTIDHASKTLLH